TFFCNETATTEIYTLSLHDALPISGKLEDAEQYYVQAIEIQKERGDRFSIFHLKNDLSNILLEQGNIQEAEKLALATFKEAEQRSEEHTSELQSRENLVCRLLLEKK